MYSRIYKKEKHYQVYFFDKGLNKKKFTTFKDLKDAVKFANEIDIEYYTSNVLELPKGITLDKTNKRFRFHIWIAKDKQKHILSSNSLEKIITCRNYMLLHIFGA